MWQTHLLRDYLIPVTSDYNADTHLCHVVDELCHFLNPKEKQTLIYFCETLIPSLEPQAGDDPTLFKSSASDVNLADLLEDTLALVTNQEEQTQLRWFLRALENGLVNGLFAQQWCPFSEMPFEARERVLHSLALNRIKQIRVAFRILKRLALFIFYTIHEDEAQNPAWESIEYQVPNPPEPEQRPITAYVVPQKTEILESDVLVIGSGAGGGVVAGELAAAGHDVIVVEKGRYYHDTDFKSDEYSSVRDMYEKHGTLQNSDNTMLILAGSVLGGGTTINWTASLKTPDQVLAEWAKVYGFTGATSPEMQASFDAVCARINVNANESHANPNNAILEQGCQALGYHIETAARNVKGCEDCSFCNFGCPFGAKQSTLKTYLQDAYDSGAKILVQANVERILQRDGKVTGAMVTVQDENGDPKVITIQAKVVVVSAGTIHTPAILLRSGLRNPNIGANLHLHPTTAVSGLFEERVDPWVGAPLVRYSDEFADLDGQGYGVRLENSPAHPGIFSLVQPWVNARMHKQMFQKMPYFANIIIIGRDRDGGRITVDKNGQPIIHYSLSDYDAAHLIEGMKAAIRIYDAVGAQEIATTHKERPAYMPGNGALGQFISTIEKRGLKHGDAGLYSAHQMSSCRIAGDPSQGALKPTGESYEVKNLYVADGSALPTATGVNPMISIMGTAHYIAQQIKTTL